MARSKKKDILVPLMEAIMRAGRTGIIVNASLAREFGFSQPGMSMALKNLCEKRIVICSSCGHNKRVSAPEGMTTHDHWLPLYFGGRGNVFPRYRKYLKHTEAVIEEKSGEKPHKDRDVVIPIFSDNTGSSFKELIEGLIKENKELHLLINGILEENTKLKEVIKTIQKILPSVE